MLSQTASVRSGGRKKQQLYQVQYNILYTKNIIIQFLISCPTESTVKPRKLFLFSYIMPKNPNGAFSGKSMHDLRAAIPEKIVFLSNERVILCPIQNVDQDMRIWSGSTLPSPTGNPRRFFPAATGPSPWPGHRLPPEVPCSFGQPRTRFRRPRRLLSIAPTWHRASRTGMDPPGGKPQNHRCCPPEVQALPGSKTVYPRSGAYTNVSPKT